MWLMSQVFKQGGLGVLAASLNYFIMNDMHIPNQCNFLWAEYLGGRWVQKEPKAKFLDKHAHMHM